MAAKCSEGFFPKDMSASERAGRMSDFGRKIYPIWMSILNRDIKADNEKTPEQIAAQDVLLECLTLHKQDLAIRANGAVPDRMVSASADFRKRVAASEKHMEWTQR